MQSNRKKNCYLTMVWPILEYACTVWSPYTHVNKHKIEMVQHQVARFIMNRYSQMASVTEMFNKLNLPLLSCRRDLSLYESSLTITSQYQTMI